ncbi:transcriptional regulator, LysR family [Anaerobranca californiensis DSM 14826]|jgi:DNA-binding transcriptional LysR family regulator|uniref:Transcriptional regulator, LysR family n=1 Tax=Anaerobranca californiensis DSM 14826 TaxID=1120989 RepID=A0A1M6QUW7_9FIRM|nr:LysR family transcriptional regulator [Anaerobranca californiensis]SHK23827.1 transcriptional regulator, LysR family [Anaerobranca californiensis DSM 14826]
MNIEHLRSFSLVVKLGSITKAAKQLHVSQPALSLQIQELEKTFNSTLLNRTNKGVSPTPIGDLVYNYSQKVLQLTETLNKEISSLKNLESQEITVGASEAIGEFALPCSVYIFKEKFPKHEINVAICDTKCVIERVMEGTLPMGIVEGIINQDLLKNIKGEGLVLKKFGNDKLVIIAPYNNQWKTKESIPFEELKKHNIILQPKSSGVMMTLENTLKYFNHSTDELKCILKLSNISAIISSVTSEHGISILPRMAIRKELRHRTLKAINITDIDLVHPIHIIYNPTKIQNNLGETFFKFLCSAERGFC